MSGRENEALLKLDTAVVYGAMMAYLTGEANKPLAEQSGFLSGKAMWNVEIDSDIVKEILVIIEATHSIRFGEQLSTYIALDLLSKLDPTEYMKELRELLQKWFVKTKQVTIIQDEVGDYQVCVTDNRTGDVVMINLFTGGEEEYEQKLDYDQLRAAVFKAIEDKAREELLMDAEKQQLYDEMEAMFSADTSSEPKVIKNNPDTFRVALESSYDGTDQARFTDQADTMVVSASIVFSLLHALYEYEFRQAPIVLQFLGPVE